MVANPAPPPRDFPFYNGVPVAISTTQWWWIMAALLLALALLVTPWPSPTSPAGGWVHAVLFCAVPLAALALIDRRAVTALFRRPTLRDGVWMVAIAVLNIIVTTSVALALTSSHPLAENPMSAALHEAGSLSRVLTFLRMVPQLLGEELLTLLPFLALLQWLLHRPGISRRWAIVLAWLLSALPFALAHLPTYDWNLLQCLVIIGSARLVLTLAYLATRNVWTSTGAHVLNDWTLFAISLYLTAPAL